VDRREKTLSTCRASLVALDRAIEPATVASIALSSCANTSIEVASAGRPFGPGTSA
jgi:hypothetical protein